MLDKIQRYLRFTAVAVTLASYWCLSITALFGPWILIVAFTLMAIMPHMEWLDRRFTVAFRQFMMAAVVFALPFLLLVGYIVDWVPAVVGLVLVIQAHELLREKDTGNYQILFLMSICVVFVSCVKSQEATLGLALLAYTVVMLFAMYLLHVFAGARGAGGRITTEVLQEPVRNVARVPVEKKPPLAYIAGIVVITLALTALTFTVLPRTEAGVLGGSDVIAFTVTGLSDSVKIVSSGTIERDASPVMKVTFPEEPGGQYEGKMYWRTTVLDEWTGTGWERRGQDFRWDTHLRDGHFVSSTPGTLFRTERLDLSESSSRLVKQIIFADGLTTDGLPILNHVFRVDCRDARIRWNQANDFTVTIRERRSQSLQYTAYSEIVQNNTDELQNAPDTYDNLPQADLRFLTEHNLLTQTAQLIESVVEGAESPYEKAVAIEQWLRAAPFEYSLVLPEIPTDRPVDTFLLNTRIGHCQLFASAMALALRSQGIPARVVSGYLGGEWDENDRSYTVTADMAHLWVEAYFMGVGWQTFDPSPVVYTRDDSLTAQVERLLLRSFLQSKMLWYQRVVGFDSPFRLDQLTRMPAAFVRWLPSLMRGNLGASEISSAGISLAGWIIRILVVLTLATAVYLLLRRTRFRNAAAQRLTPDQARAVKLYLNLIEKLRKEGVNCDQLTSGEVLEKIAQRNDFDAASIEEIVKAYNLVRFGHRPLDKSAFQTLLDRLKSVRIRPRQPA